MRTLLTTASLLVCLSACDGGGRSTTTQATADDGKTVYSSKTRVWADHARFECRKSSSGACHFVVFTSDCPAAGCTTNVLWKVSLAPGNKREIDKLPVGFRYCLDYFKPPVAPNCRKT